MRRAQGRPGLDAVPVRQPVPLPDVTRDACRRRPPACRGPWTLGPAGPTTSRPPPCGGRAPTRVHPEWGHGTSFMLADRLAEDTVRMTRPATCFIRKEWA